MLDPYAGLDPYARLGMPQQAKIPALAPEEENSLLGKIAGAGLGGLGYVGSVLEKTFGGRAIRGLLGGKPRELLSVLPGSDTFGLTDENDRVSGKELLGFDKDDDSWGGMLAGMGTELALDPSTYLTFGGAALGRAGQVAKKIGQLPGSAAGRVGGSLESILAAKSALRGAAELAAGGAPQLAGMGKEALGGLMGVGLPFMKPAFLLGEGQSGLNFLSGAGKVAGAADSALKSIPVVGGIYDKGKQALEAAGRYGGALFDKTNMGAISKEGQLSAQEAHAGIAPAVAEARKKLAGYYERLKGTGLDPTGQILGDVIEGVHPNPASVHPEILAAANDIKGDLATALKNAQDRGVNIQGHTDLAAGYLPRQRTLPTNPTPGFGAPQQPLMAADSRLTEREDVLRNILGGKGGINRLFLDELAYSGNGRTALDAADHIRQTYLHPGVASTEAIPQARKLADFVASSDPQFRASIGTANPLQYFGNHPLADLETYYSRMARLNSAADASQGLLVRTAELRPASGQLPQGGRTLVHALEDLNLTGHGAQDALLDRLRGHVASQGPLAPPTSLLDYHVPASTIAEGQRYNKNFTQPEAVGNLLGGFDWLTNLTKAHQTAPWPGFHVRNRLSGVAQNMVAGGNEAPGGLLKASQDAYNLIKGGEVAGANQVPGLTHLANEAAQQALQHELYAWGVGGHVPHLGSEIIGPARQTLRGGTDLAGFGSRIPGEVPKTVGGALSQTLPRSMAELNPLNIEKFAPIAGGREMGNVVEGVNRGELFMSLRRQGYTDEAAAAAVAKAHFDYTPGGKTPFERQLSRLIPFYTYSRQNIPYQIEQLATKPGGFAGTAAKVSHDLRQQAGFLPDYMGSGLAIPTGDEENGVKRFLTRLDLPPEQAFEMLHGGQGGMQRSLMGMLGQLNPMLKAPLEYASGKQFYTGRDLADLYSETGSPAVDQLISNSPVSRLATTLRTLADERKWQSPSAAVAMPLNLLTGAKVSDVDMEKQRNIAAREYVTEALRGQPDVGRFETIYPKVSPDQLTPQEMLLMRLNKTLQDKAIAAKKQVRIQ